MRTADKRRARLAVRTIAMLVILLAITGVVLMYTVGGSLGQPLIGGSVVLAVVLTLDRCKHKA